MKKVIITIASLILFGIVSLVMIGCDPDFFEDGCHSHIKLKNNSNRDICTDATFSYPDTTISDINPLKRGKKTVSGTTSNGSSIGGAGICIESAFVDVPCEYISVFIFDAIFMEDNLDKEYFRTNESMALQRYDLTLENLNNLGWIIPYPPNELMKNMKMYPQYEE